jgi:solute carrier family 25 phosphate transporter 3
MKAFAAGGIASQFGSDYYLKSAVAGGICCSITHGALCPVDVVKTRIQLGSIAAADGLIGGMRKVVAAEGMGVLATGLGATAAGYFVQGFFKFGGFEFFKIQLADKVGPQSAWDNRNLIYLGASACAEFIADIFLCPLEAVRIRSVSDATFPKGLGAGAARMLQTDGVLGFYAGLGPILFKQIPYTMAKFAVQGKAAELMFVLTAALIHWIYVTFGAGTTPAAPAQRSPAAQRRWESRSHQASSPVLLPPSSPTPPTLCCPRSTRPVQAALAPPPLVS